jgi:hypothetical protein
VDVTVIGHGSLMSGHGLSSSGMFFAKDACVVALSGCRRGFAKLSRYGDRFATDLEISTLPLEARVVPSGTTPSGEVEALALTVPLVDFCLLAKREGYSIAAIQWLKELGRDKGCSLAEFLWELHAEAGHDMVEYRRRLFALTSFTSPHYIPHPIHVKDVGYAIIFLAPGFEGTGSDEVISVRQQTGVQAAMSTSEAWRQKPNTDQMNYFLSCLLGGVHGISVRDFLSTVREEPSLALELRNRLRPMLGEEPERFLAATSLSRDQYRRRFGTPEGALARSGLKEFLDGE